ncbi:MAG: ribonuclease P protein component [Acidimicrobiales bacterium]
MSVAWVPVPTGTRATAGDLGAPSSTSISSAAPGLAPPAVAFAIGRKVGGAVTRNRLRRRLRDELAATARAGDLGSGCYLVGLHPDAAILDSPSLRRHLQTALGQVAERRAA